MASRAIVAILTVCAVALASGQEVVPSTPPAGTQGATVDATLSVTLSLSPPDVQAAIQAIRDNSAELRQIIDEAIARISADAKTAVDKLDSFLQNLKEGVQAAGNEISDALKEKISAAVDKIRALIAFKKQLLEDAVAQAAKQLDEASQRLRERVAKVTEYIQNALAKIRDAVNKSRLVLTSLKNRVNAAIDDLSANINGQEIQSAIQNAVGKLQGGAVQFGDVLKAISTQLLAAGNSVSAGFVSAVGTAYSTVSGILGGISGVGSLNLDISVGAGAGASATAA